jgi:hypothetical protein
MLSNRLCGSVFVLAAFSCCLAVMCVFPVGVLAAGRSFAALTVEQAGPDYALVGEFAGNVTDDSAQPHRMAIQVRAIGNGDFEAAEFQGPLPGETGFKPGARVLLGRRSGNLLVFTGGPHAILANPDRCLVLDGEGKQLGRLDRVTRVSPTLSARPPRGAIVIFDNGLQDTGQQLTRPRVTEDGLLMPGTDIKPLIQDFTMHLEFMLPYMPAARGQDRANSGIYIHSRYELQILDSFAQEPAINSSGAIYEYIAPEMNLCLPPLVWQTYDIVFTAPRWAADNTKLKDACLSLWYNGVQIHNNVNLARKTGLGSQEGPQVLPINIQDHNGDPVRFRNIWIVDRGAAMPQKLEELTHDDQDVLRQPIEAGAATPKTQEEISPPAKPAN